MQVTREVHNLGVELVSGEGLTYHTRENRDTYFWYAWDASHAWEAKKPCFSYPTITRNRKSTREVHFRYASDAESTREIHVQRVRSMYNAWDACTPRAKTRENQHLTRNNASGACISRGTYAWDTSHWSIPAKHTCISRVITRGMNATKLYQEIIYVPHAYQNAWDTCHKTITGNHICTKRVPKRVGHMPKNYTRNSPIGTQL